MSRPRISPAPTPEPTITVELTERAARALLAAEPFHRDSDDWFEGRDVLMNGLCQYPEEAA